MFHKRLTWACDLIIVNACCLVALQAWLVGMDWVWGISILNCIAVIALRQWLMKSLQIPWLTSILNQGLKRIADILISSLFLVTVFPVIIVIEAIRIKSNKRYGKGLFSEVAVCVNEDRRFTALAFSSSPQQHKTLLDMTPLVLHILTGKISLNEITSLSVKHIEYETEEQFSNKLQEN